MSDYYNIACAWELNAEADCNLEPPLVEDGAIVQYCRDCERKFWVDDVEEVGQD